MAHRKHWPILVPGGTGRLCVLRSCVTCLCPATSVEMERITVRVVHRIRGGSDIARARCGDPAALPRQACPGPSSTDTLDAGRALGAICSDVPVDATCRPRPQLRPSTVFKLTRVRLTARLPQLMARVINPKAVWVR